MSSEGAVVGVSDSGGLGGGVIVVRGKAVGGLVVGTRVGSCGVKYVGVTVGVTCCPQEARSNVSKRLGISHLIVHLSLAIAVPS
jgi:hypothetical protein